MLLPPDPIQAQGIEGAERGPAFLAPDQNLSIEKTIWVTERLVVIEKVVAEHLPEKTDPRS